MSGSDYLQNRDLILFWLRSPGFSAGRSDSALIYQAEEGIHEFWARFEGHLHNMSRSAISIAPILQTMLFLRALHPRYKVIIDLFASKQKGISIASIDSIILDAQFMDELSFFGSIGNPDPITDDLLNTASPPELSLSSAGCQIIRGLHHVVPSCVLCDPISSEKGWFFCRFLFPTMSVLNSL